MRAKAATLEELRKSIAAESDDDATRSSSGGSHQRQQLDLTLLRKPILTAVTGFLEAQKAYEDGTEELRKLLTNECDILYECRVCRNIFRSLTNFISHKRVYCRKLFNAAQYFHFQNDGFWNEDITTILQAERDCERKGKKSHTDVISKDLTSIVERLRRKQFVTGTNLTDYYNKLNHKLTLDDLNQQQHLLQLDEMSNSQAAVYQSVHTAGNIRVEVDELEKLANNNNNTVLGPDGKVLQPSSRPESTLPVISDPLRNYLHPAQPEKESMTNGSEHSVGSEVPLNCSECSLQFDTEKTLTLHTERRHSPATYVYPCPCCSETFLQCRTVMNHLTSTHKKTWRRVRQMRDAIIKRRSRVDEVTIKGPARELARLRLSSTTPTNGASSSQNGNRTEERDEAAATRAWMENLEHFDQGPMCSYCGKTFDRKAVLTTHMQTCVQKIRQTENSSVPPPPSSSASSSCGRRSKVRCESPAVAKVKVKEEPVDIVCSDDSNSYDVPLSTLQARLNVDAKKPDNEVAEEAPAPTNEPTILVKPEELTAQNDANIANRRKRKKPMIMLRNASDDISWEIDDCYYPETVEVESALGTEVKLEPVDEPTAEASKAKKSAKHRRKKSENKDGLNENEVLECMQEGAQINCRCGKKYIDPDQYKRHIRVFHKRQRRFWCAICSFKGYRKVDAVNHIIQEHEYKGSSADINALINVQPTEKCIRNPAHAHLEPTNCAVSDNCDTVVANTDICFSQSATESSAFDISLLSSTSYQHTTPNGSRLQGNSTDNSILSTPKSSTYESFLTDSIGRLHIEDQSSEQTSSKKASRRKSLRKSVCSSALQAGVKHDELPDDPTSKRPIRNRIKPVDKDFVYDLTHLLCKEEELDDFPLTELMHDKPPAANKPKTETSRVPVVPTPPEKRESKRDSLRSHAPKPKPSIPPELYRGAACKMAKRQVELGNAAFYRPPELPKERAFLPSKLSPQKQRLLATAAQRRLTTIHDWPVVKKERKVGAINKSQSDIQIHRKYTKRASTMVNIPISLLGQEKDAKTASRRNSVASLSRKASASLEILNKLNASRAAAGLEPVQISDPSIDTASFSEADFKRLIEANLKDHRARMSQVNLNGTTPEELPSVSPPRKRITLMQRLEENRTKRLQEQSRPSQSRETQPPVASASSALPEMLNAKLKRFSSF